MLPSRPPHTERAAHRLTPSAILLRLPSRACAGFFRILLVAQSRRHQEVVQENHERNVGRLRFAIEGLRLVTGLRFGLQNCIKIQTMCSTSSHSPLTLLAQPARVGH